MSISPKKNGALIWATAVIFCMERSGNREPIKEIAAGNGKSGVWAEL